MKHMKQGGLFHDEDGMTTTGMVLSLFITLSLVFTAAQVYRISSASAEVQDVADACALAAENQVAEFMLIARFCDAVVLSLSLTGITTCGVGVVALCVPQTAEIGIELLDTGKNLIKARDKFAKRAAKALNKIQEALPYISAACAASVAQANNADSAGSNYLGVSILVPSKGEALEIDTDDGSDNLLDSANEQKDDIKEKAKDADEAAEAANRAKERAFMRDCGDNPSYCMYERAASLAGLAGSDNPLYSSVDTWSFQVALDRAQVYYRTRWYNEAPADWSIGEQARSALRSHFYHYAVDELDAAFVHDEEGSFEAYFPHLPRNTAAMRLTRLYTDSVYPITRTVGKDGKTVTETMHAWAGCPEVQKAGTSSNGSIAYMESAGLATCPVCGFTASSMGSVASASTSIPNGFEYHYEAVADEAAVYQEARHRADSLSAEVKDSVSGIFDTLSEAIKNTAGKRISPAPPGRYGVVAFVVNAGATSAAGGFASGFVSISGSLGPRAAVSAATLLDEGSDEGRTALNSALGELREDGDAAIGAIGIVLDAWSWLLVAYSDGQGALVNAVRLGLDSLPLVSASGLGTWASDALSDVIKDIGLQPAEIGALKPVLLNSAHVAAKGSSSFASRYVAIKQRIVAHPFMSTDLFGSLLTDAEQAAIAQVSKLGDSVQIASIELFGENGPSIPVTIPLPAAVKNAGISAIQGLFSRIRSFYVETTGVRIWE